jgi:phosphoribosyl-dephospho-CoA transferase
MYLHNNDINQILTKYYYQGSQLCYQILVNTNDGLSHIIEDYHSYSDYKRAMIQLEEKLKSGTVIEVKQYSSEKSVLSAVA